MITYPSKNVAFGRLEVFGRGFKKCTIPTLAAFGSSHRASW